MERRTRLSPFGRVVVWFVLPTVAMWAIYAATRPNLPEHQVMDRSRIVSGYRIALAVSDPYFSSSDCEKLLKAYASDAKGGQVSVHKPAPLDGGKLAPLCYDNQDGKGAQFH